MDLRARAKTLKLRIDPLDKTVALDLRKEFDRDRSVLLHRLRILDIGWGEITDDPVRSTGTFRETWVLRWRPELAVSIIDAALWGTTVAAAASAKITDAARRASDLVAVTAAVEGALLADLPDALPEVLRALDEKAALDQDVAHLMAALPALVRALRYGDVRGTDTAALAEVARALIVRICAGLPAAVGGLADDAAAALRARLDAVHAAVALHAQTEAGRQARDRWLAVLTGLADRRDVHGLLAGRIVRLLVDSQALPQRGGVAAVRGPPVGGSQRGRTRRPGPRASWPAAACCWCTTATCSRCWTAGSPASARRSSWTCCRCCGGHWPGSRPRNGPTWPLRCGSSAPAGPRPAARSRWTPSAPRACCARSRPSWAARDDRPGPARRGPARPGPPRGRHRAAAAVAAAARVGRRPGHGRRGRDAAEPGRPGGGRGAGRAL